MKVQAAVVLLMCGTALASLEPAGYIPPSSRYLPPNDQRHPSALPTPPSNHYVPAASSDTFQRPELVDARRTFPSTSYGVPDTGRHAQQQHQRQQYEERQYEPAKYNFAYEVKDGGNDFDHHEERNGELTRGSYSVVLPDGRKQIVEYEADEAGFRPRISYEETAAFGRYQQQQQQQQQQTGDRASAYPGAPY